MKGLNIVTLLIVGVILGLVAMGIIGVVVLAPLAVPQFIDVQGLDFNQANTMRMWAPSEVFPFLIMLLILLMVPVCAVIGMLYRLIFPDQKQLRQREEESEMLRQLWQMQERMEERLVHLETILLERRS